MEWLSQNWIWLVLIAGVVWLLSRSRHGGLMGGCGAHDMAHEGPAGEVKPQGADAAPAPANEEKAGQAAQRPASSQRHGRGGCC
ncbi:MAG: hypothetical protein A3G80_06135 [Betaproteobacteria bacterium RIFCSPLOWO2_12_FULL_62_13b]|nr:MAG: hypothetical protein A3G80_06135 [Betaproteobacteria bacterium RIFCSPLOWO2_12_FULL_62_13b]